MSATGKHEGPVALEPVIARLRQIAAEAGDHLLLGDGPPCPDAKLLDLCSEIVHQARVAEAAEQRSRVSPYPWPGDPRRPEYDALCEVHRKENHRLGCLLRQAGKLHATTGVGIYAKALAVRHSSSGAHKLSLTLAEDLIANPGLRALLWGTEPEPAREE